MLDFLFCLFHLVVLIFLLIIDGICDALWGERPNSIRGCNLSVVDICPYVSFSFVLPNAWIFKHALYM